MAQLKDTFSNSTGNHAALFRLENKTIMPYNIRDFIPGNVCSTLYIPRKDLLRK